MALKIDSPNLNGRSLEENVKNLQTWAVKLSNNLNYGINHLDSTNFTEGQAPLTEAQILELMDKQYMELRQYIINMVRGKG